MSSKWSSCVESESTVEAELLVVVVGDFGGASVIMLVWSNDGIFVVVIAIQEMYDVFNTCA